MKIDFLHSEYKHSLYSSKYKNLLSYKNCYYSDKNLINNDLYVKHTPNISFAGKNQSKKIKALIDIIWSDENLHYSSIEKILSRFKNRDYIVSLSQSDWKESEKANERILIKSKKVFEEKLLPRLKNDMLDINSAKAIKLIHKIANQLYTQSFTEENSLKAMLEYIKMLKIAAKDSISLTEKEKIQYDICQILGNFSQICEQKGQKPSKWFTNRFNKEINSIIDYHFGKDFGGLKENTNATKAIDKYDVENGFCMNPEFRKELKTVLKRSNGNLRDAIVNVTGDYSREIYQTIYALGILTPKAQKQLSVLIALNKKGLDLTQKYQLPTDNFLLFDNEKIPYYKKGKLTPSQVKFNQAKQDKNHEEYFRMIFGLDNVSTSNAETADAALDFFNRNGAKLNDLPSLEMPDLKKAFRKIAIELHPDLNGNGEKAKENFQTLFGAYKVLSSFLTQRNQASL